jgi:ferrous iron transport protein B
MPLDLRSRTLTVALIGNPNTGKSTLFNALVGIHQHVGNYPGVTVEKKSGRVEHAGQQYEVIDLPGLYSLAPRSRDEMVATDVLMGRCEGVAAVDAVVCLVDASNLQRHLYLLSQVLEFGLPTVVVVNMLDVAESHGIRLELARLQTRLGVPVVPMQAHRGIGLEELKTALEKVAHEGPRTAAALLPAAFEAEVDRLAAAMKRGGGDTSSSGSLPRCLLGRLLLDVNGYLQETLLAGDAAHWSEYLAAARARLAKAGCEIPGVETAARYDWVRTALDGVVTEPRRYRVTASDRIDHILTHRVWGLLIFAALMFLVFQAVFVWARPVMKAIDTLTAVAGHAVEAVMAEGALRSLLVDGVIGGTGGVLAFLPQILILFAFIAVLEDCGYMARAAFLMDRIMVRVGLSGRSFIPMLSSFACAVPGIMAARVIENERDRMTTILVAPLMTCSARLPIYALLIAAFIPDRSFLGLGLQGLTLTALYVLGVATAVVVALVLKRTLFRGKTPPFLMELPSYKWPAPRTVAMRVAQRGWIFLRTAGTLILAVSIVVWAALYYPHDRGAVKPLLSRQAELSAQLQHVPAGDSRHAKLAAQLAEVDRNITGEYQRHSILGHLGHAIEPVVRPLGWDWRIGCAVLASFPAREVVVATLGVIYNLGKDVDLESEEGAGQLREKLRGATWDNSGRPVFSIPVALSIMVFFALCAQCAATLAVIRRETASWRWPAFTFAYMTALAYVGALLTYQVGSLF